MRRVVLESPYAVDTVRHVDYARACLKDCLARGEAPIASHLLLTQVLDEQRPEQRGQGIAAGHLWIRVADAVVLYADLGLSAGMEQGIATADLFGVPVETRYLGGVWAS